MAARKTGVHPHGVALSKSRSGGTLSADRAGVLGVREDPLAWALSSDSCHSGYWARASEKATQPRGRQHLQKIRRQWKGVKVWAQPSDSHQTICSEQFCNITGIDFFIQHTVTEKAPPTSHCAGKTVNINKDSHSWCSKSSEGYRLANGTL